MKRHLRLLIVIFMLISATACTLAPANQPANQPEAQSIDPTPEPTQIEESQPDQELLPFLGIWFSEDRTSQLIITDAYLYFHDFTSQREVYAQVVAANLVENSIDLRMQNIIHSGQQMGFDSPMITVQYQTSMQGMQVWLNRLVVTGGDQPVLYLHDEVLNPE